MRKDKLPFWFGFLGLVLVTGSTSSPSIGTAKPRLDKAKIVEVIR
jgi:hypothetical protein